MAIVETTMGVRANDDVNIQSVSGTGPWDVVLAAPPAASTVVGDKLLDEAASQKTFLITAIAGSTLTVRDAFGAAATPSAAGASQAYTNRVYAYVGDFGGTQLDDTGIYDAEDTARCWLCENVTSRLYTNEIISGGGTIGLAAIELIGHANYRHNGTLGATGVITDTRANLTTNGATVVSGTAIPVTLDWLVVARLPTEGVAFSGSNILQTHATGPLYVRHCLIFTNEFSPDDEGYIYGIANFTPDAVVHIDNCMVWGINNPNGTEGTGITFHNGSATSTCYNTSVYGSKDYGCVSIYGVKYRNVIAMGSGTDDFILGSTPSGSNTTNLSSDATANGPGSLVNQVVANTLVDAEAGDLHLKTGSSAIAAGASLQGVRTDIEIDIDGETRSGLWCIGAEHRLPPAHEISVYDKEYEMIPRQISTDTYPVPFFMALTSDHVTGATGLTPTVTIRKPGGVFAGATGAVTEIAYGHYEWAGNATDRNTLGDLVVHITAATADPCDFKVPIVTHDPFNEGASGGDATEANQTTMLGYLEDIMGTGFVPGQHALDQAADVAAVADGVWDENIVTGHGTANTSGLLLRATGSEIAGRSYNNTLNDLLGVPDAVGATVVTEAGGGGSTDTTIMHSTSVATVVSQTSMTLTSGSTDNNAYTNCLAVFTDQINGTQKSVVRITAYTGATMAFTLEASPAFVVVPGDSVSIMAESTVPLSSSTVSSIRNAVMNDDVTARLVAGSAGKAINTLTTLGARTNNANLNSLLGVADEAALTAVRSNYFCRHKFIRDGQSSMDEYSCVRWWKDDEPLTTGITSPTIRVIHGKTGADLIPQTSLTEAGSSHLFYYEATGAQRIAAGQAYSVVYRATIDGEPRVSEITIGRDVA